MKKSKLWVHIFIILPFYWPLLWQWQKYLVLLNNPRWKSLPLFGQTTQNQQINTVAVLATSVSEAWQTGVCGSIVELHPNKWPSASFGLRTVSGNARWKQRVKKKKKDNGMKCAGNQRGAGLAPCFHPLCSHLPPHVPSSPSSRLPSPPRCHFASSPCSRPAAQSNLSSFSPPFNHLTMVQGGGWGWGGAPLLPLCSAGDGLWSFKRFEQSNSGYKYTPPQTPRGLVTSRSFLY